MGPDKDFQQKGITKLNYTDMKTAYRIGSFRGIEISFHWTFLLLLGWLVFINLVSVIAARDIYWDLLLIACSVFSLVAHETGHALAAKYYGINTRGVLFLPLGSVANTNLLPRNPRQEMMISFSGPAVNLLIAFCLLFFLRSYPSYWHDRGNIGVANSGNFVFQLHLVNLLIGVLNLIPAFPFDGGRILRSFLSSRMNIIKATHIAAGIGSGIAYGLIFTGVLSLNLFLILPGFYILLTAGSEAYCLQLNHIACGLKLKDVLILNWDHLDAESTPLETAGTLMTNNSKYFIVMEEGKAVGTINRMEIIKHIAEKNFDCKIKSLMKTNLDYMDGDAKVSDLIEKMADREDRLYPVMDQSHFAGFVSFQHIMEYLLIHNSHSQKLYGRIKSVAGI